MNRGPKANSNGLSLFEWRNAAQKFGVESIRAWERNEDPSDHRMPCACGSRPCAKVEPVCVVCNLHGDECDCFPAGSFE